MSLILNYRVKLNIKSQYFSYIKKETREHILKDYPKSLEV